MSDEEADHLLYIQFPVWVRLLAENQNVLERVKIVPLKNIDLYNRAINLTGVQRDRIDSRLSYLGNFSDEQMSFLRDRLPKLPPDEELEPQEVEVILEDLNFEDPGVGVVRDFIDWSNNWIRNTKAQDEFIFQSILDQDGHGLVIGNRLHRRYLEDRLQEACLESIK